MTQVSKKAIYAIGGIIFLVAIVLLYELSIQRIGDGHFRYVVHVQSSTGVPKSVRFEPYGAGGDLEELVDTLRNRRPTEILPWQTNVENYDGAPLPLRVPNWLHDSRNGWFVLKAGQYTRLLFVAEMVDGAVVIKVVPIPDAGETREMTVTIP